jgi:hypothetical protein
MIQGYEYMRISNTENLESLNIYSCMYGWRVVYGDKDYFLLERPLTEDVRKMVVKRYNDKVNKER